MRLRRSLTSSISFLIIPISKIITNLFIRKGRVDGGKNFRAGAEAGAKSLISRVWINLLSLLFANVEDILTISK